MAVEWDPAREECGGRIGGLTGRNELVLPSTEVTAKPGSVHRSCVRLSRVVMQRRTVGMTHVGGDK